MKYYNKYLVGLNQKQQIKKMKSQTLWQLLLSNRDAIKKIADEKWWMVFIIKHSILFVAYLLVYIDRNHIGMNLPMLSFMFCHIEQYSHHFGLLEKRSKWKQYHYWYGIKLIVSYTTEWIVDIPFSSVQKLLIMNAIDVLLRIEMSNLFEFKGFMQCD